MTEAQQALDILLKEQEKVNAFSRLEQSRDFQLFLADIDKQVEVLRTLLEVAKDEDLANVRGQLKAVRGIINLFKSVISRRDEIAERIKELQND